MKTKDFFSPLLESGAEPTLYMPPRKQKMTASGKALIRALCTEKPWRRLEPDEMWVVPEQYADGVDIIAGMFVSSSVTVGTFGVEFSCHNLFGGHGWTYDEETGERVTYLAFHPSACEEIFSDDFLEMLGYFSDSDWDALISRDTNDDDFDEHDTEEM